MITLEENKYKCIGPDLNFKWQIRHFLRSDLYDPYQNKYKHRHINYKSTISTFKVTQGTTQGELFLFCLYRVIGLIARILRLILWMSTISRHVLYTPL